MKSFFLQNLQDAETIKKQIKVSFKYKINNLKKLIYFQKKTYMGLPQNHDSIELIQKKNVTYDIGPKNKKECNI